MKSAWSQVRRLHPFPNGCDHAPYPVHLCSVSLVSMEGSRGKSSHLPCFFVLTAPFGWQPDSVPPRGLAALWAEKRPLVLQTTSGPAVTCAADLFGPSSHLEHRDASRSGRAHCVRWVARLYQKTSLVLPHWTGKVDWVPEAFTCPVSLDRPGRQDFEARWLLRLLSRESLTLLCFTHPFLGPTLCSGMTSHRCHCRRETEETATTKNPTAERPEGRERPAKERNSRREQA